jgi:hypothetical protein
MTYQHDYRISNPNDPWRREWGTGSAIAALVSIVIMAGIVAYGAMQALT